MNSLGLLFRAVWHIFHIIVIKWWFEIHIAVLTWNDLILHHPSNSTFTVLPLNLFKWSISEIRNRSTYATFITSKQSSKVERCYIGKVYYKSNLAQWFMIEILYYSVINLIFHPLPKLYNNFIPPLNLNFEGTCWMLI